MKNILTWALLICLLQMIVACDNEPINPTDNAPVDEVPVDAGPPITSFTDCEWLLLDFKQNRLPAKLKRKVNIQFTKGTDDIYGAGGKAFLNVYTGAFRLDEKNKLVISVHLTSTLMGGPDDEMAAEEYYLKGLYRTKSYGLSGNVLTLTFDNGEEVYFVPKR
ncbi:META domain-containing protein [Chryseolinea sp. T2]|uniref:META domain-containing protein n=1 Tax=Chryseolinea sp. T2 TaxID=3129255 RepID=UPI003077BCFC